jgi:pimeloyl-ACP methyl ester carboxylesterase
MDPRGFGLSDKSKQVYSIERWADDIAWIAQQIGIERAVIVGHSLGGAVALAAAANHPGFVAGAVLCDPVVVPAPKTRERWIRLANDLKGSGYIDVARKFIGTALFIDSDDPAQKERILDEMVATEQPIAQATFAAIAAFDSHEAAKRCSVPILNIDAAYPVPDLATFRKICPTLITGQTVGAGHFHQLLVPDQINAMIERFLVLCET